MRPDDSILKNEDIIFTDRVDAGRRLAGLLQKYANDNPIVLGLPRGGVVLAFEVARALRAPLDVIVVRKIGAPFQPELALGAIAPEGILYFESRYGLPQAEIDKIIKREKTEMNRCLRLFRGKEAMPEVEGRTVILVDDGLATGASALAAIFAIRKKKPNWIVLAVGVCAKETINQIKSEVDELVCVCTPEQLVAIGNWYDDFSQVSDLEVIDLLKKAQLPGFFDHL